jgi:hypothetical protein
VGVDGKTHISDQATVWRWRPAFQNDFAARMDWTVKEYSAANHAPAVVINGIAGRLPVHADTEVNQPLTFDAAGSRDPDGNALSYHWFHYPEAGFVPQGTQAALSLSGADTPRVTVISNQVCRPDWQNSNQACPQGVAHLILAVTDDGSPALTSYRRVILTVHGSAAR